MGCGLGGFFLLFFSSFLLFFFLELIISSSPGNITPLHIDLWHGILVQVIGSKSIVLFSPDDTPYLYQNSSLSSNTHTCKIDLTKATTREFASSYPLFDEAVPYTAILAPGNFFVRFTSLFYFTTINMISYMVIKLKFKILR